MASCGTEQRAVLHGKCCRKKCLLCVFSGALTRELKVCVRAHMCVRVCVGSRVWARARVCAYVYK